MEEEKVPLFNLVKAEKNIRSNSRTKYWGKYCENYVFSVLRTDWLSDTKEDRQSRKIRRVKELDG